MPTVTAEQLRTLEAIARWKQTATTALDDRLRKVFVEDSTLLYGLLTDVDCEPFWFVTKCILYFAVGDGHSSTWQWQPSQKEIDTNLAQALLALDSIRAAIFGSTSAPLPALTSKSLRASDFTDKDIALLVLLRDAQKDGRDYCGLAYLEKRCRLERKAIGRRLKALRNQQLVTRRGERGGHAINAAGKKLIANLPLPDLVRIAKSFFRTA